MTHLRGAAELLLQVRLLRSEQPQLLLQGAALPLPLLQQSLALLFRLTAQSRQPITEVLLQVPANHRAPRQHGWEAFILEGRFHLSVFVFLFAEKLQFDPVSLT